MRFSFYKHVCSSLSADYEVINHLYSMIHQKQNKEPPFKLQEIKTAISDTSRRDISRSTLALSVSDSSSKTKPSDKMLLFSTKPIIPSLITTKCNVLKGQGIKRVVSYTTHIKL